MCNMLTNELCLNKTLFTNTGDTVARLFLWAHMWINRKRGEGRRKGNNKRSETGRQVDVFLEPEETLGTV